MDNLNYSEYDTIVLSGGAAKGILLLGSIEYMYKDISHINTYIGCSVGGILCYLLILGYTPIEILTYLIKNKVFSDIIPTNINITNILNNNGIANYNKIDEHIKKLSIDKIGKIPTLLELYNLTKKRFICNTYNWTIQKLEFIDYTNNPDLPANVLLHMSCNLPLIFSPFHMKNNVYFDGGIFDVFPIDYAITISKKVIGIYIDDPFELSTADSNNIFYTNNNLVNFLYTLLFIPTTQTRDYKISNILNNNILSKKCIVIKVVPTINVKIYDFNISIGNIMDLFCNGYNSTKNYIQTIPVPDKKCNDVLLSSDISIINTDIIIDKIVTDIKENTSV